MIENILDLEEEASLSEGTPNSLQFQGLWRARKLAWFLTQNPDRLEEIAQKLDQYYHQHASVSAMQLFGEHQIGILSQLRDHPDLWKKILSASVSSDFPLELMRYALQLEEIESTHAPVMLLSAALTPLRQNVGSCFATAPAMTVQRYHLEIFVDDALELMQTAQLKRIFRGEEYIAPLCRFWNVGDLPYSGQHNRLLSLALQGSVPNLKGTSIKEALGSEEACAIYQSYFDHAFLKAWEYTLASFCEYKIELYKWNLLAALGFDPNTPNGIGQIIHAFVSEKLEEANQTMLKHQQDVEIAYGQMKAAESFFRDATSYRQARHSRIEHIVGSYQFDQSMHERDQAQVQAENYAQFFNYLIDQYRNYFEIYFQEIFDPQIIDVNPEFFADSPAGFRLTYKHGRKLSGQWTMIYDKDSYLAALVDFFRMTENQLIAACDWDEGKKAIESLTTTVLQHLQTDAFIEGATSRARAMHKKAQTGAKHLTPWSYLSGGSMEQLLKCYFCLEKPIAKEEKIVKSPTDLLVFLIETMKNAPPSVTETQSPLFAYSPVHAFRLMPHWQDFKEAWMVKDFTYTWVRDHCIAPYEAYYIKQKLSQSEQREIIKRLNINAKVKEAGISLPDFRNQMIDAYPLCKAKIDGYLVECKPGIKPLFFADTNWPGLFFAFAINPGTLELDLWRADPEFKYPCSMHMWRDDLTGASQKPWGVFLHKFF